MGRLVLTLGTNASASKREGQYENEETRKVLE